MPAAWWLSEPNGGEELAYTLLTATCSAEVTTEHVYLGLITPSDESDRSDGLEIIVSHYPPGTSKLNKMEHRLFSRITQNWCGRPLEDLSNDR